MSQSETHTKLEATPTGVALPSELPTIVAVLALQQMFRSFTGRDLPEFLTHQLLEQTLNETRSK